MENLTTSEKLDLLDKLLIELMKDFNNKAELVKDLDHISHKLLTEDGSSFFKNLHDMFVRNGKLETFKTRIEHVNKVLSEQ